MDMECAKERRGAASHRRLACPEQSSESPEAEKSVSRQHQVLYALFDPPQSEQCSELAPFPSSICFSRIPCEALLVTFNCTVEGSLRSTEQH